MTILIIGAGIGGLSAALALLQRGIAAEVYEEASELGDVGAGLSIQPNARRVLASLGLIEDLADDVVAANGAARRDYWTGEILSLNRYEQADWRTSENGVWFVHRADLHRALVTGIRRLAPGAIHLDHQLVGLTQDDTGVEAHFANGRTVRGTALVGADGLRSATRAALFGPERPRFSGIVAWRGLVPMERLPPGLISPDSCRWIGPTTRILCYPVRRRTLLNFVAAAANQTWQVESWKVHSELSELLAAFEGADPTIHEIVSQTPPELLYKWALFDRDPLPTWTVGRVTLLGDAAHPMLPFLGQGAGIAMEDAIVLARCLEAEQDVAAALARYERVRKPRATTVQLESRANAQVPFDRADETSLYGRISQRQRAALEAYDATTVPI
ncbi:MAG: FAD-dependent monooxygenase [Chloroflexota bacterium]|nr:FAD-dependent monooxygenase [Dehalococcoidia bacterium]MDW8252461.1 FAD-dependent monooxygenase [Chloroflexota bacterium]